MKNGFQIFPFFLLDTIKPDPIHSRFRINGKLSEYSEVGKRDGEVRWMTEAELIHVQRAGEWMVDACATKGKRLTRLPMVKQRTHCLEGSKARSKEIHGR